MKMVYEFAGEKVPKELVDQHLKNKYGSTGGEEQKVQNRKIGIYGLEAGLEAGSKERLHHGVHGGADNKQLRLTA